MVSKRVTKLLLAQQSERPGDVAHGPATAEAAAVRRRRDQRGAHPRHGRREGQSGLRRVSRPRARPHRAEHEGGRAGPSRGPQGRRRDRLVQRPAPHRSALRASHRGDALRRGPRSRGQPADRQSRLRLPGEPLAEGLERLRLRELEHRHAVAPQHGLVAPTQDPRPEAHSQLQQQERTSFYSSPHWSRSNCASLHDWSESRVRHSYNFFSGHCYQPPNGTNSADWGHVEQEWTHKPNNTTIIRINQSHHGTPQHHHQFHQSQQQQQQQQQQQHHRPGTYGSQTMRRPPPPRPPVRASYEEGDEPIYDPVAPKDFECHDFDANPRDELDRRAEYRREHGIIDHQQSVVNSDVVFVKENGHQILDGGSVVLNGGSSRPVQLMQSPLQPQQQDQKSITTVEVHQPSPPPAPSMPQPVPYKWPAGLYNPIHIEFFS
ncbi:unnamed protein product [Trichogramma brassicae]|uniref:Uncharacterized protein n=1 Tax=Trichogramma brassicae TaxID=86971 RepID=A0A6H5IKZ6_9HYME|nr:unnamed protein product [Trichogramma brassicae]